MRFSHADVVRFAAWSRDRNPLHVDAGFARQTYFGQPIVYGILTVLGSLASASRAGGGQPHALSERQLSPDRPRRGPVS